MPIDLAPLRTAARDADDVALAAWADALEEQGDEEGAAALRSLPALAVEVQRALGSFSPSRCGFVVGNDSLAIIDLGAGDATMSSGQHHVGGVVLPRWNDFHPALEWLARRLDLRIARVCVREPPGTKTGPLRWKDVNLHRAHLQALPQPVDNLMLRQP
jgi:hypothetical protein